MRPFTSKLGGACSKPTKIFSCSNVTFKKQDVLKMNVYSIDERKRKKYTYSWGWGRQVHGHEWGRLWRVDDWWSPAAHWRARSHLVGRPLTTILLRVVDDWVYSTNCFCKLPSMMSLNVNLHLITFFSIGQLLLTESCDGPCIYKWRHLSLQIYNM